MIFRTEHMAGGGTLYRLLPLTLALLLSGCATTRQVYDVPGVQMPTQYATPVTRTPVKRRRGDAKGLTEAQLASWWKLFRNRQLDELVDLALANNADLRIAAQRVVQAAARSSQTEADRFPLITAPIEYRGEAPPTIGTVPRGGTIPSRETYSASLRGDWKPDVWGEFRSAYRSSDFILWSTLFEYDRQREQVIGGVVGAYVEYLSLNDQLRGARETEQLISGVLTSLTKRYEKGDATAIDLERQKAAVYATQTLVPTIELEKQRVKNRLARLTGTLPQQLELSGRGLNTLTYQVFAPGVPSYLLLYRPDVRAVEAELLAADADIDVARAQVLPTFTITGQVGYGSLRLAELFEPHTLFWRFIATAAATIFDHGRRKQEVKYAESVHQELVERYYRTIYDAVTEVEGALASIRHTRDKHAKQAAATRAAKQAWDYSVEVYGKDNIDYFAMLDTARTYQRHLLDVHKYNQEKYLGLVNLYVSLGAGVPERQPLPGEGARPTVQQAATPRGDKLGPDGGWEAYDFKAAHPQPASLWLAELSGIHSRDSGEAAWRTLARHFPKLVAERALLARIADSATDQEGYVIDWYALYVEGFDSAEKASAFCTDLGQINLRCSAKPAAEFERFEGRLAWPKTAP